MERVLSLAAALVIAGCSLFRDPVPSVAEITSVAAPDTARAGTTFSFSAYAMLGVLGDLGGYFVPD